MMMENKQKICDLLCETLKATRYYSDLISLEYVFHNSTIQTVTARFENGGENLVNVSLDSGVAMIRDILKQID